VSVHILLLDDVEDLGRSGEIVRVRPGYFRNFLQPKRKAIVATPSAQRLQDKLKAEREKRALADKQASEELSAKLAEVVVHVRVKVDPDGNLYGSVTAQDVTRLLEEQGIPLEKRSVQLKQPIKVLGVYPIVLRLKEGVMATIQLHIDREEVQEEAHEPIQEPPAEELPPTE
jgi:large subunit ribosomal protein L9